MHEFGVRLLAWGQLPPSGALIAAVAHRQFRELTAEDLSRKVIMSGCFMDIKETYDRGALERNCQHIWRL